MTCPTCGQENLPGTAFCENCGTALPAAAPTTASVPAALAHAAPSVTGKICPNCGYQNGPDDRYCDQCGASLDAVAPSLGTPQPIAHMTPTDAEDAAAAAPPPADALIPSVSGGAVSAPVDDAAQIVDADATITDDADLDALLATPTTSDADATGSMGDASGLAGAAQADDEADAVPQLAVPELEPVPVTAPVPQPPEPPSLLQTEPPLPTEAPPVQATPEPAPASQPPQTQSTTQADQCVNCGAALAPNARFCMECGTKVEPPAATPSPALVRPTHCTNCGAALAADGKFCMECGTKVELVPADGQAAPPAVAIAAPPVPPAAVAPAASPATAIAAPPAPPATPTASAGARLVASDGTVLPLDKDELVVGREDPISGVHPDLDMTPFGGESGGVSRRHAMISNENGQWVVTDLDSTNYTRVDGTRLTAHTPTPLTDGAKVQFGRLDFEFHAG